jgi:hypothetical protein
LRYIAYTPSSVSPSKAHYTPVIQNTFTLKIF